MLKSKDGFFGIIALCISYFWLIFLVMSPLLLILGISLSYESFGKLPYIFFIKLTDVLPEIKPNWNNLKLVFHESIILKSFFVSLKLSVIGTISCLLVSYPMAYGIFRSKKQHKNILMLLILIPFWTSLIVRVYAWIILLRNNGVINNFLMYLDIIDSPIQMLNTEFAVIIGFVYTYLPFMIMPLYASLEKIDISILNAAEDLGAKPMSIFFKITVPMTYSGIIAGSILVFIPLLGEFVIPELLGGINVVTIGKVLWGEFFLARDWLIASSVVVVLIVFIVIPFTFLNKFIQRNLYEN
jgi:putrescine transport system permease protein